MYARYNSNAVDLWAVFSEQGGYSTYDIVLE